MISYLPKLNRVNTTPLVPYQDDLSIVIIPNSIDVHGTWSTVASIQELLLKELCVLLMIDIPDYQLFIPPLTTTPKKRIYGSKNKRRSSIPSLSPSSGYVVIDDVIHTGRTFLEAQSSLQLPEQATWYIANDFLHAKERTISQLSDLKQRYAEFMTQSGSNTIDLL